MKDFIHGQLVKAASTGGVDSMLKGAGVGAAANVGIGAVQGDFDVIGNAFSGAALGGMGGAGMKYGANRYAGNLMKQADAEYSAASKKVGIFSNVEENKALSFFGGDANTERFVKMNEAGVFSGRGYDTGKKVITGTEWKDALTKSMDENSPTYKTDLANLQKMQPERTIANMMNTQRAKPASSTPATPKASSQSTGTAASRQTFTPVTGNTSLKPPFRPTTGTAATIQQPMAPPTGPTSP